MFESLQLSNITFSLGFMFSNDLRKVRTSIKLQLSVITCINSGIVAGLFLNTFFRYGKTK
jgi:hypothetical protein